MIEQLLTLIDKEDSELLLVWWPGNMKGRYLSFPSDMTNEQIEKAFKRIKETK